MIRHGESLANAERRFTRSDDEPLTELGVEQALETGRRLAEVSRPVTLYASPYQRAHDTARHIGAALDLEPVIDPAFYEQSFGELEGQPYESFYDLRGALPEPHERWFARAPGGESLEDVMKRVGPALDALALRHLGEEIVVVSHGGVMAALRAWVRGHFDEPPESTVNALGYRLRGAVSAGAEVRWEGPLDLFG